MLYTHRECKPVDQPLTSSWQLSYFQMSENSLAETEPPEPSCPRGLGILLMVKAFGHCRSEPPSWDFTSWRTCPPCPWSAPPAGTDHEWYGKASGCLTLTRRPLHFQDNMYIAAAHTQSFFFHFRRGWASPVAHLKRIHLQQAGNTGRHGFDSWVWKIPEE